jgi:hypothetical protein
VLYVNQVGTVNYNYVGGKRFVTKYVGKEMSLHRRHSNILCIIIQYITSLTLCKHPARHWATVSGEAFIKSSSANTKSCTAAAVVPRNSSRSNRTGDRATAARASNPQETVMVFASDHESSKTKLFKNPISLRPITK